MGCCGSTENQRGIDMIKSRDGADIITDQMTMGHLRDHKMADDDFKNAHNPEYYLLLNSYEKYEKTYPFFRMDVNGFCLHVREAVVIDLKNAGKDIADHHHVETKVSLASIQETFKPYKSWAELNDTGSNFVRFLVEECSADPANADPDAAKGKDAKDIWFDCTKLKIMGIMWGHGDKNEKIIEIYNVLQANHQDEIAWNDRQTKRTFYDIFDVSTELIFKHI